MTDDSRRISHSELKDFQRCKRRWWLKHVRRLAPRLSTPAGALQSGTRVHEALAAYYDPGSDEDPRAALEWVLRQAHAGYMEQCGAEGVEPDQAVLDRFVKDAETERAMVEGYTEWLAESGADAHLTVIDAEQQVTVTDAQLNAELVKPFTVVGKLDARVIDETTGYRLFVDHKTVQNFTQVLPGLQADTQMLHYHLLEFLSHVGEVCDGALYNMLRKVKRTKTAKPPFFMRERIVHSRDEIESYRLRLIGLIVNIFELEARLEQMPEVAPAMFAQPNPTRECSWDCDFVQICTMFDDGSRVEDAIQDLYRTRDPLARYGTDQVQ